MDEELEMTLDQFKEKYGASPSRDSLTILVAKLEDAAERLLVYFPEGDLGVKQTRP